MGSMSYRSLARVASIVCAMIGLPGCTSSQHTCGEDQETRITSFVAGLSSALEANAITTDVELPQVLAEGAPVPFDGILVELDHAMSAICSGSPSGWSSFGSCSRPGRPVDPRSRPCPSPGCPR
jgi:hypothetical protein